MSDAQDTRRFDRLNLPGPLRARFMAQGMWVEGVEIITIGAGGFGAWVEERYAQHFLFEPGHSLAYFRWEDESLPAPPARACIAFSSLRGQSTRPGYLMIGAEFLEPSEAFVTQLMNVARKVLEK